MKFEYLNDKVNNFIGDLLEISEYVSDWEIYILVAIIRTFNNLTK